MFSTKILIDDSKDTKEIRIVIKIPNTIKILIEFNTKKYYHNFNLIY